MLVEVSWIIIVLAFLAAVTRTVFDAAVHHVVFRRSKTEGAL